MTDRTSVDPDTLAVLEMIVSDRILAHEFLFSHRHKNATPNFHREIIKLWHSPAPRLSIMAFRGGAKSTIGAEEATCIRALLGQFRNGLIVGETYDRAKERLAAIKHELENNEAIIAVFGNQIGPTWTENKIELPNGVVIQSLGRGQSLRGTKHHDQRPDYLVIDDLEDENSVRTEDARKETIAWVISVLLPAMDKNYIARVIGTPLESDSLMDQLEKDSGWQSRRYPIEYVDEEGERVATWPDRFSLREIDEIKSQFTRMGMLLQFGREYLCEARSGETRVFTKDILRVKPRVRSWHPVWVMYDPARTVKSTSAHTGKVAFSWIGNELIFWEGSGHFWRPDEIVRDIFDMAEKYDPVVIGVEKTGLEEFIMQPIRQEASKRNVIIPIRPMDAPKGKEDFIRGLQPFFMSGEATMAVDCPDMISQFLNFPKGKIDIPNAAAYALKLRPGLPVYEDFTGAHIIEMTTRPNGKYILACNYSGGALTGVLYRRDKSKITIHADMVIEGDPAQRTGMLLEWASHEAGGAARLDIICHKDHFERYATSGFVGVMKKMGVTPRKGGECVAGRGWMVNKLQARHEGMPDLRVVQSCKWFINAMSGGYAFEFPKAGKGIGDRASEGIYRTLMEGFEAACALAVVGADNREEEDRNYSYTREGHKYLSSLHK